PTVPCASLSPYTTALPIFPRFPLLALPPAASFPRCRTDTRPQIQTGAAPCPQTPADGRSRLLVLLPPRRRFSRSGNTATPCPRKSGRAPRLNSTHGSTQYA